MTRSEERSPTPFGCCRVRESEFVIRARQILPKSFLTGRCIPTSQSNFCELREEGKELEIEFDF